MIESSRGWEQIDRDWAFAESSWHPKCWSAEFRFLLLRQRRPQQVKGALQLDLFEPRSFDFEYKVIVTNKHGSARSVLLFHNGRGSQEKIFGEAKQHAALDVIPTRTLCGNQLFTLAAMLTHNLTRELQMQAAPRDCTSLFQRGRLSGSSFKLALFGSVGCTWPAVSTRPAGRLTLTITENPVIREDLERFLERSPSQRPNH